jgi:hypothetical protein
MSNDTDVYVTLTSNSETDLLAAVAYLRNKDRTWRLDVDDVRKNGDWSYSVRLYGWANENSLGNYHITGEAGEMGDLGRKFPNLEINGWYRDEYSSGSLYGGEKSYESSHGEDGGGRSLQVEVGSLRRAGMGLSPAMQLFSSTLVRIGHFGWLEESGSSTPYEEDCPPCIDFSIEDECDLGDEEICKRVCEALRSMDAPKDLVLKLNEYYGDCLCEEQVWGNDHIPFKQVRADQVDVFLEKMNAILEVSPENMLDRLPELTATDLGVIDDDNDNNVLHYAAEQGTLDQVPEALLTRKNLLCKNYAEQTPVSLAHDNGHGHQLPEEYRDENFSRDYKRKEFVERLIEEGKDDLATHIIRNFPNPLMTDRLP